MYVVRKQVENETIVDIIISADKAVTEGPDVLAYRLTKERNGEVTCSPLSGASHNLPATAGATGKEAVQRLFVLFDRREAQRRSRK